MILIFDASGINALKNDPESTFLLAGIASGYFTRVTEQKVIGLNFVEGRGLSG